jgi:DNA primase
MELNLKEENKFYKKQLLKRNTGKKARQYLKSRGIEYKTVKEWEIGWSPFKSTPLCYNNNSNKKPWTKMWGRITFPIRDQNGKIISISGRLIDNRLNGPKYDHYSFPSRKTLFGLSVNKKDILKQQKMVITEGQFDVITAWQKGLKIVTSTFGAHCSLDHLAVAARYTKNIHVIYDSDNAGQEGLKGIRNLHTKGDLKVKLHANLLPKNDDLDSWLRKNSLNKFYNLINQTKNDQLKKKLLLLKDC